MLTHLARLVLVSVGTASCASWGADAHGRGSSCDRRPSAAIHDVQGHGGESPLVEQTVTVEGVVTAVGAPPDQAAGFYLQAETPDGDPLTSEGLFVVWSPDLAPPARGRRMSVRGRVREVAGITQLHAVELVQECGSASLEPTPLGVQPVEHGERWDSMWVTSNETWTLVDTSRLLEHGETTAVTGSRLFAAGHELGALPAIEAERRWLIQEDWLLPRAGLEPRDQSARLRLGARVHALDGIVHVGSGERRLLATQPVAWRWDAPAPLPLLGGALRVAAFNLDNYFVSLGALGASTEAELSRQRSKLVAALVGLDADVLALTELENREQASLEHLISALNERLDPGRQYAWSMTTPPATNPLRAALVFRPSRVAPVGEAWFDGSASFRRPPLFQTFERRGSSFTLGVVHFKSKRCGLEPEIIGPGGCGTDIRLAEATELVRLTQNLPPDATPSRVLLLGDFNTDPLEPPLSEIRRAGFIALLDALATEDRYSYVFRGRASLLDHAFATPELARDLQGAAIWHINADEPEFRGYRLSNPPAEFQPDALRSSDHDPILIDLRL
jgi:hypothetical protein